MPSAWSSDVCSDRKSTRLNSSHTIISYAVFCLKKQNNPGGARVGSPSYSGRARPARGARVPGGRGEEDGRAGRAGGEGRVIGLDRFFFLVDRRPRASPLFPNAALSA